MTSNRGVMNLMKDLAALIRIIIKVDLVDLWRKYSGLKNRCNVWQFWSGCDVVLDRVRIMLSVGGVK